MPAATIASALGMAQIGEHETTPPFVEPGGRVSECRIVAWKGSRAKARIPNGTSAQLTIETGEEDLSSPLAAQSAKSGASNTRELHEADFKSVAAEAEGYVSVPRGARTVGPVNMQPARGSTFPGMTQSQNTAVNHTDGVTSM